MATIARDSALEQYTSYGDAIIGPVIFPLAFACIGQAIVYSDLIVHRFTKGERSLIRLKARPCGFCAAAAAERVPPSLLGDMPVLLVLPSETVFALCCIVQCAVNWSARSYVGKELACNVQGFYAGYYAFGGAGASALAMVVCVRALDSPFTMTSARCHCVVLACGLAVNVAAIMLAALPFMGVGEYLFAVDYCIPNVEAPTMGTVLLVWLTVCFVAKGAAAFFAIRSKHITRPAKALLVAFVPHCLLTWSWLFIIAVSAFANGGVAGTSTGYLYGANALFLHTNQLIIPIYFGWVMRSHLYQALRASDKVGKVSPTPIDS